MALSYKVTLAGVGSPASLTITGPEPNTQAPCVVPGVVHRTQGGSIVSYQVGPAYWQATLKLPSLRNADKANLEAFFRNNFGKAITYTDENGNNFTAYFLDTQLPLVKMQHDLWTCDLHLNLSQVLI